MKISPKADNKQQQQQQRHECVRMYATVAATQLRSINLLMLLTPRTLLNLITTTSLQICQKQNVHNNNKRGKKSLRRSDTTDTCGTKFKWLANICIHTYKYSFNQAKNHFRGNIDNLYFRCLALSFYVTKLMT